MSIWLVGPSIALYYATVPFLLYSFPCSFTLGEAVIVSQGTTLLLVDTALQLLKLVGPWVNKINDHNYTIYNEKYSFCVLTHSIGQNGRAVCKKNGGHGDAATRVMLVKLVMLVP